MAKKMSSKVSAKKQLSGYANRHNPNNKADKKNRNTSSNSRRKGYCSENCVLDEWFYYGNPSDFE